MTGFALAWVSSLTSFTVIAASVAGGLGGAGGSAGSGPSTGGATPGGTPTTVTAKPPASTGGGSTTRTPTTTTGSGANQSGCPTGDALVGLTVDAATARARKDGCTVRVVERDGRMLPATRDWRPKRLNVAVKGERVTTVLSIG